MVKKDLTDTLLTDPGSTNLARLLAFVVIASSALVLASGAVAWAAKENNNNISELTGQMDSLIIQVTRTSAMLESTNQRVERLERRLDANR